MYTIRVLAVMAILVGAASANPTPEQAAKFLSHLPGMPSSARNSIIAQLNAGASDIRGRELAEHEMDMCGMMGVQLECSLIKDMPKCTGKCAEDSDEAGSCAMGDTDSAAKLGMAMMVPMITVMAVGGSCAENTVEKDCVNLCQWVSASSKCAVSQAGLEGATSGIEDKFLKAYLTALMSCQMVHGTSKEACEAAPSCNFKPAETMVVAPTNSSGRKLLGSEGMAEGTCEPTEMVMAGAFFNGCGVDTYNKIKETMMNDPSTPQSVKDEMNSFDPATGKTADGKQIFQPTGGSGTSGAASFAVTAAALAAAALLA